MFNICTSIISHHLNNAVSNYMKIRRLESEYSARAASMVGHSTNLKLGAVINEPLTHRMIYAHKTTRF